MSQAVRSFLAPVVVLLAALPAAAQIQPVEDVPRRLVPIKEFSPEDVRRTEALTLYGLATWHEHNDRLLEALRTYEAALKLEPDTPALYRALIPLYLALDRGPDALAACAKVLELVPDDFAIGYLYARQLAGENKSQEAVKVLKRLLGQPTLKDHSEMHARISYDLGLLHEAASAWAEAEAAFRQTAELLEHPAALLEGGQVSEEELATQAAETYERLGRACLKRDKSKEAVAAFEKAQKKDPLRAARLSYNLAEVFVSQGDPREALVRLNEYLNSQPQGMEAYELKITLLRKLERAGDIVPELEGACGRDAQNAALKLLLAREYRKASQPAAAERIYQRLLLDRATPDVYRALFDLLKDDPRTGTARALAMLDDAVKNGVDKDGKPGDAAAAARARAMLLVLRDDGEFIKRLLPVVKQRLQVGPALANQTRLLFAGLASRAKQLDVAEDIYRSCLQSPAGVRLSEQQDAYNGLLLVLLMAHKYEAIIEVCKEGLQNAQDTNRVMFHRDLTSAYVALGKIKEALASADEAVKDAGERDKLHCRTRRAGVLSWASKHKEAIAECQALLNEYNLPGDIREVRNTLASVYSAARQHDKAEEQLKLILDSDPNDATANNDLGYLWADQNKNLDEAERLIRKALDLDRAQRTTGTSLAVDSDQDNAAYVDSLGWVLFRKKKYPEARTEMERAVKMADGADDPTVWDHLGDVYFRLEDRAKARAAWTKSAELYEAGRRRSDENLRQVKDKLSHLEP
jgi:tetratricopeptide (TPR) repeat protein